MARPSFSLAIIGVLAALTIAWISAPPTAAATRESEVQAWEHLALTHENVQMDRQLSAQINRLGNDGWELVTVTPITRDGTTSQTVYYFKRPK